MTKTVCAAIVLQGLAPELTSDLRLDYGISHSLTAHSPHALEENLSLESEKFNSNNGQIEYLATHAGSFSGQGK